MKLNYNHCKIKFPSSSSLSSPLFPSPTSSPLPHLPPTTCLFCYTDDLFSSVRDLRQKTFGPEPRLCAQLESFAFCRREKSSLCTIVYSPSGLCRPENHPRCLTRGRRLSFSYEQFVSNTPPLGFCLLF